jgi:hypothetical protein
MSIRNIVLATFLLATAVSASATTAQQEKMKTCLSNAPAAPAAKALTPQQERMKSCNADPKAKILKGDERKAFMKTCLSGG